MFEITFVTIKIRIADANLKTIKYNYNIPLIERWSYQEMIGKGKGLSHNRPSRWPKGVRVG